MIMKKTINQIKKNIVLRKMKNVLNIQNESFIDAIHDLLLNSSILIFRENNTIQLKT